MHAYLTTKIVFMHHFGVKNATYSSVVHFGANCVHLVHLGCQTYINFYLGCCLMHYFFPPNIHSFPWCQLASHCHSSNLGSINALGTFRSHFESLGYASKESNMYHVSMLICFAMCARDVFACLPLDFSFNSRTGQFYNAQVRELY